MIIQEPKLIFIHIPKNAGTSIESIFKPYIRLNNLVDRHAPINDIKSKLPSIYKKYTKFAVVRNPYDRATSYYSYLKEYNKLFRAPWNISFIDWLKNPEKVEIPFNSDWINKLGYFNNQSEWIDETVMVLKYEKLEKEFLGKRKRLYHLLLYHGYNVRTSDFHNTDYSEEFDMFLYKEVGYEKLTNLTSGLFLSPYGATSLREYFANCFEHFYLLDRRYVRDIAPQVFAKINIIENTTEI